MISAFFIFFGWYFLNWVLLWFLFRESLICQIFCFLQSQQFWVSVILSCSCFSCSSLCLETLMVNMSPDLLHEIFVRSKSSQFWFWVHFSLSLPITSTFNGKCILFFDPIQLNLRNSVEKQLNNMMYTKKTLKVKDNLQLITKKKNNWKNHFTCHFIQYTIEPVQVFVLLTALFQATQALKK